MGSPFFDTKLLTLGCLHQSDVAFPACQRGVAHPPEVGPRLSLWLPPKPLQPTKNQRALSVTKTSKDGEHPA